MMDVDDSKASTVSVEDKKKKLQDDVEKSSIISDMIRSITYITKGVESNQPRFIQKAIRQNVNIRRHMNKTQISYIVKKFVPSSSPSYNIMMQSIEKLPTPPPSSPPQSADAVPSSTALPAKEATDATKMDVTTESSTTTSTSTAVTPTIITTTPQTKPAVVTTATVVPVTEDDILTALSAVTPANIVLPEIEVFIFLIVIVLMLRHTSDQGSSDSSMMIDTTSSISSATTTATTTPTNQKVVEYNDIVYAVTFIVERSRTFNRRTLDLLNSKIYFYFSFCYEKIEKLENIRSTLLTHFRTCCIRHDEMCQSVLLNLILRNYLHYNLIEQAHTFSLRTTFPESVSNNQFCRYLYYMGRIQAIQLEYTESFSRLMLASRKAPQDTAQGFNILIHKLSILVQLLMGEIPEKSIFNQKEFRVALEPYLALTQTVRNGNLQEFHNVTKQYESFFQKDKNLTLVYRLGHNVIKTGLRKISLSYSRISMADVAEKLHLPSASSAEYICAKAIRDGVIEASIDHADGWLVSTEVLDVYSTEEPQNTFHKRIAFCLDVYNEGVRSMRYPPDAYKKELQGKKNASSSAQEEEKSIEELIKEMEDDLDE